MTTLVLGNRHAIHSRDHGETFEAMAKGKRATTVEIPDGKPILDVLKAIIDPAEGLWSKHATDGAVPAWVASDNATLAAVVSMHFGGIEIRDLEVPTEDEPAPKRGGRGGAAGALGTSLTVLAFGLMLWKATPWLKTNGGNDFQAAQMAGSGASATAVAKWMAITANATAESASDTTLTAEIATAGGGLLRQVAVYAHTTSAASYTLTGTFTANGSDALPVTIAKMAVFNASASGTMVFEKSLPSTATLSAIGDNVVVTQTVSL